MEKKKHADSFRRLWFQFVWQFRSVVLPVFWQFRSFVLSAFFYFCPYGVEALLVCLTKSTKIHQRVKWRGERSAKNPPSPLFRFLLSVWLNSEVKFWLGTTDFRNMQILGKALFTIDGHLCGCFCPFWSLKTAMEQWVEVLFSKSMRNILTLGIS